METNTCTHTLFLPLSFIYFYHSSVYLIWGNHLIIQLQFHFENTLCCCCTCGCDVNVSVVMMTAYRGGPLQILSRQLIPAVAQATLGPQWIVPVQEGSRAAFHPASPPPPDNIVLTRLQHDRSATVADSKALFQTLVHGIKWMKGAQRG